MPDRHSVIHPTFVLISPSLGKNILGLAYPGARQLKISGSIGTAEMLALTAAHEMFHLVQDQRGLLAINDQALHNSWVLEGTAEFMADEVFDPFNHYQSYRVDKAFTLMPLDSPGATHEYDTIVFFKYQPELVPALFGSAGVTPGDFVGPAGAAMVVDGLLGGLPEAYLDFTYRYNYLFQGIEEIDQWESLLGRTPTPLSGAETAASPAAFSAALLHMSGETFVGRLTAAGSVAQAFQGHVLQVKVKHLPAQGRLLVCSEPGNTCQQVTGPLDPDTMIYEPRSTLWGFVTPNHILQLYLYQYQLKTEGTSQTAAGLDLFEEYSDRVVLAQAAVAQYPDALAEDPFSLSNNAKLSDTLVALIEDFYLENALGPKEAITIGIDTDIRRMKE